MKELKRRTTVAERDLGSIASSVVTLEDGIGNKTRSGKYRNVRGMVVSEEEYQQEMARGRAIAGI